MVVYRICSLTRTLRVDNQSTKTRKPPSSVSWPKLYRATSCGDWWYYRQARLIQEVVVGSGERDLLQQKQQQQQQGKFLSKYIHDIA